MTNIRLDHISKTFAGAAALYDIDFQIQAGELFFLLGPSGCGKSTLLRIIAGLLAPSSGRIFFNDRDVTREGTERRNAVMCFQGYALWPHLSVRENVRFGLKVRQLSPGEQLGRTAEVLKLVQLEHLADRKPNTLSGGEQQRAALARALAVQPDCLLLDEPLSNLDAKLRLDMRSEIRRICKTAGFTTIYVTHDQKEALAIADRIAILQKGQVIQIGTPQELYQHPRTSFVADFLGETNKIKGKILERNSRGVRVQSDIGEFIAAATSDRPLPPEVIISLRPQHIRIVDGPARATDNNRLNGKIIESIYLGDAMEHVLQIGQGQLKLISPVMTPPQTVTIEFAPKDVIFLPE